MNAEAKVITAVCQNGDIAALMSAGVDDLFVTHGDIWKGVKNYYYKYHKVPDIQTLVEKYRDFEPAAKVGTETKYYVDELRNAYVSAKVRNIFIDRNTELGELGGIEVLQKAIAELSALNKISGGVRDLDLTDFESAEKHYKDVAERAAAMGGSMGIPTGYDSIDSAYPTGLAPGQLIVVIGWPGRAKTWFTGDLAVQAWKQGFKPMIVSLEMSPEQMRDRLYTIMGEGTLRNSELMRGQVNVDDFRAWGQRTGRDRNGFVIVSPEGYDSVTPAMIQQKIDQHRPDIVICDYHQLFEDNKGSKNEVERNKNVSREFKQLGMRNQIPIIDITAATSDDLSQRETAPMLSQVAWSKAIEYDADMAIAVHKDKDSNLIEIVSRKNRFGPDFAFYLDWDLDTGVKKEVFGLDDTA